MNIRVFFLYFIFIFLYSCTQEKRKSNANLNNYVDYEKSTNKEAFLDSLYILNQAMVNDSLTRENLMQIAAHYEKQGINNKFFSTTQQVYTLALTQKDTLHQAQALWYLGDYYESQQIQDSAYYYYLKAEQLYASQKDSINWAKMLSYKAGVLYDIGIYTESETATAQALHILSQQNNTRLLYEANIQMVLILKAIKEYETALKYYSKIPTLLQQLKKEGYGEQRLQRSWLSYYNNLGTYYNEINQPQEAQKYFEIALADSAIDNFPKLKAMLLNNYANNQVLMHYDNILIDSLLNLSLQIRQDINHKQGIIANKINIAEFKLSLKDTIQALQIMQEAFQLAVDEKSGYEVLESLKFLSEYDQENRDKYTAVYIQTHDSLRNLERQTRNKFARIAYETNEIEKRNDILIQRNTYLWAIISLVSVLLLIVFIVFKLRLKNKKLLYLQKEQQAVQQIQDLLLKQQSIAEKTREKERKRIAKDLHDAIVNRVFTTRINLDELATSQPEQKAKLVEQLKQTETQIRTLAHDIHKNLFDQKQDFSEIIKSLVHSQKNTFKTTFECSIDNGIDWSFFTIQQKTQIYLIVQELLQNVNKHSHATKCIVIFLMKEDRITIRVHDDGIGIDKEKVKKGMGFRNITHRLKQLNGEIKLSDANQMTTITLEIQYNNKK